MSTTQALAAPRHVLRNDGSGGSNPSCGTSNKSREIRSLWALRQIAAVRIFGNLHDFSHLWDGLDGRAWNEFFKIGIVMRF
jgi:hypothetical protein